MTRKVGEGKGRKPVTLVSSEARGESSGYQAIWEAIREQRQFSAKSLWLQVHKRCGGNRWTIKSYIERLLKGGFIAVEKETPVVGAARRFDYTLVKDVGVEAPRLNAKGEATTQGLGRENMWRTIAILKNFSAAELAVTASTDAVTVTEVAAKDYLKHLFKAGYLVQTAANRGGHSLARYRLVPSRRTGPLPPQVQRIKAVFDPNLGKVVWPKEVTDERD